MLDAQQLNFETNGPDNGRQCHARPGAKFTYKNTSGGAGLTVRPRSGTNMWFFATPWFSPGFTSFNN
jgi:hypothetical protein